MPEVKEIMFDDDTFTDLRPRAEEIARGLGKLGVTWSCNAKANVPYSTLKVMKENGLRLLLVGYESGDDQILVNVKKGLRTDMARRFSDDCRKLGIKIHGTFILGLPGETHETIQKTIQYAKEINPHTIQVSLAAPYPGTVLHKQAVENGWLEEKQGYHACQFRRHSAIGYRLSASVARRDFSWRRGVLQALLFQTDKDLGNRARDACQLGDDETTPAGRRGVLQIPPRS